MIEKLRFLDIELGMSYCMDDEEFYESILENYMEEDKREKIQKAYDDKDIENYRITVHALKSTSLTIGAAELSEKARELEMAAKSNDWSFITENTESALAMYSKLLENLKEVFGEKEEAPKVDEEKPYEAAKPDTDVPIEQGKNVMVQQRIKIEPDTGREIKILVVDDDSINLKLAENMLKSDYTVYTTTSGEAVFEVIKNTNIDLILLDVNMPGMDGHEVISRLKTSEYLDIPVIFLTADNDAGNESRGLSEGAMDYITKPFNVNVARKRIDRILELDHLQKNLSEEVERQTRKAEARRKRVEKMSTQLVNALVSAIDAKDQYTNGHSKRVADYSCMIAKEMGYDEGRIEQLNYAGLLHDVGKIGIPDEIINKNSRLTDEEYEKIKEHPSIGAGILAEITELPNIAIGAKYHHERFDGRGYPEGLSGYDIPEVARIIGVADAYDAMTSYRSYRDVLPQDVVRNEIIKGKGTQFDPDIADVMLRLIDNDKEYTMHEMKK